MKKKMQNNTLDNKLSEYFTNELNSLKTCHPFLKISSKEQILKMLPHYLAMSLAFPYIQASSHYNIATDIIENNKDFTETEEITFSVSNFLCFEETGGSYILDTYGKSSLTKILDTKQRFHANILRSDIAKFTNENIRPNFADPTKTYLKSLQEGLGNINAIARCAHMVAFESHAEIMISALWRKIYDYFGESDNGIKYFELHVGGADPAEAYHVDIAKKMIQMLVSEDNSNLFLSKFFEALKLNLKWSAAIID